MATYVIGDVQGCFDDLMALLDNLPFRSDRDRLWFVGDLINRGPKNLETLRFVRNLGEQAVTVLGNHDMHLLAIHYGRQKVLKSDTFKDVLKARDRDQLANWLRHLPFLAETEKDLMTHAGIPHIWDLQKTRALARELEHAIRGAEGRRFFKAMYGNRPSKWDDSLKGLDRLRSITNYLTRMRFVRPDGNLEFQHKGAVTHAPPCYRPWFEFASRVDKNIYFGHWASLDGETHSKQTVATDTGCVWGRGLTAVRLGDQARFIWIKRELVVRS